MLSVAARNPALHLERVPMSPVNVQTEIFQARECAGAPFLITLPRSSRIGMHQKILQHGFLPPDGCARPVCEYSFHMTSERGLNFEFFVASSIWTLGFKTAGRVFGCLPIGINIGKLSVLLTLRSKEDAERRTSRLAGRKSWQICRHCPLEFAEDHHHRVLLPHQTRSRPCRSSPVSLM